MTQIESDAWWGWSHFRPRMQEIWYDYSRYGEVVLEKALEEDDEKFKPLFRQANGDEQEFLKIIRKFWEDNYHFVASDFKGLIKLLDHYKKENRSGALELLPEFSSYCDGETRGCDETYSITIELYKQVIEQTEGVGSKKVFLVNYDTKKFVEIEFSKYGSPLLVRECSIVIET